MNLEPSCYDYIEIWPEGDDAKPGEKYCEQEKVPLQTSQKNKLM